MMNEVFLLPRDIEVYIDNISGDVIFESKTINCKVKDIDTKEGILLLDSWHERWSSFIKLLLKNDENIWVALSGGMDSRASFAPFIESDIDLNKITVYSVNDDLHTHSEDFKIATIISERLNFILNRKNDDGKYITISNRLSHTIENYVRLGLHSETAFMRAYRSKRRFFFGGSGGEIWRSHWNMSVNDFLNRAVKRDSFGGLDAQKSILKELEKSISIIRNKVIKNNVSDPEILNFLYEHCRLRNHFGSGLVRGIIGNSFELAPLMDPALGRLNQMIAGNEDKNLLFALIYERFCPQIADIDFDSNRKIDKKTKELAQKINNQFPYQKNKACRCDELKIVDNTIQYVPTETASAQHPLNEMYTYFYSDSVKNKICQLLGEEVYNRAVNDIATKKFHPESLCYKLLAVAMIHDAISSQKNNFSFDSCEIKSYHRQDKLIDGFLSFCKKARIDIKNSNGKDNNISVEKNEGSDAFLISNPAWFTNEKGKGYMITSHEGRISITLTCICDGTLQFYFRGIDYRVRGERYPLWIDYTSIVINGHEVIDEIQPAWHDKPFLHTMPVKNGQKIDMTVEWNPHGYCKKDFMNLIETFFENPIK